MIAPDEIVGIKRNAAYMASDFLIFLAATLRAYEVRHEAPGVFEELLDGCELDAYEVLAAAAAMLDISGAESVLRSELNADQRSWLDEMLHQIEQDGNPWGGILP